tara:strand:- start:28248 stop:28451 length:204 start_codon:yes stop_codon:yes gene_type:complete
MLILLQNYLNVIVISLDNFMLYGNSPLILMLNFFEMNKALIALAVGGFGIGMTEFVIMGILPDVALA